MGAADLISETFFSSHYASIWRGLAPAMEDFVRRMNMDGYDRDSAPIPSSSSADHRGIINEAGFLAFTELAVLNREEAGDRIRVAVNTGFDRAFSYVYGDPVEELRFTPNTAEKREAILIAGRLFNFFRHNRSPASITLSPVFLGNGIISRCRGDVFTADTDILYEIKSGDRNFRSVDYRQLCVYSALYFAEKRTVLSKTALVNPRRGISVEISSQDFAQQISGQSAVSFFQSMIDCFSGTLPSV